MPTTSAPEEHLAVAVTAPEPPVVEVAEPPVDILDEAVPAEVISAEELEPVVSSRPLVGSRPFKAALWLAGFVALTVLLYAVSAHFVTGDSDGATVVLEGQSLLHGQVALHNWALSLDSFWLIDAPLYALGVLVFGVSPVLLNLVPAVIAAMFVTVGALLAAEGRRRGAAIAGAATVVVLLALPTATMALYFLRGPLHVGTALWCLLAFAALRKAKPRWGILAAVVLFAAGLLGDLQMLALGVVPAACAGIVAMARCRSVRAGLPALGAAVGGVALALAVRVVTRLTGAFSVGKRNPVAHNFGLNLSDAWKYLTEFGGARASLPGPTHLGELLDWAHAFGLALMALALAVVTVHLLTGAVMGRQAPKRALATDAAGVADAIGAVGVADSADSAGAVADDCVAEMEGGGLGVAAANGASNGALANGSANGTSNGTANGDSTGALANGSSNGGSHGAGTGVARAMLYDFDHWPTSATLSAPGEPDTTPGAAAAVADEAAPVADEVPAPGGDPVREVPTRDETAVEPESSAAVRWRSRWQARRSRPRYTPPDEIESWRLDDLLLFGVVGSISVYVLLATTTQLTFARYLTAALLFGAVVTGRFVAGVVERVRTRRARSTVALAGALLASCYVVSLGLALSAPAAVSASAQLGQFLEDHGLHHGIGSYWNASIVTVETHGQVTVRPVLADKYGYIVRYGKNSAVDWYKGQRFNFVVYNVATPWGSVDAASAERSFGNFSQSYSFDRYRILVWDYGIQISPMPRS